MKLHSTPLQKKKERKKREVFHFFPYFTFLKSHIHGNKNALSLIIYLLSHWIAVIILSKRSRIYVIEIFNESHCNTLQAGFM